MQLVPSPLRTVNEAVFSSVFTSKILYTFYISPTPETGTGHHNFLAITTLISLEHEYDSQNLNSWKGAYVCLEMFKILEGDF